MFIYIYLFCQCLVPFKAGWRVLVSTPPVCSSSSSPHSTSDLLSTGQVGGDTLTSYKLMANKWLFACTVSYVDPPNHISFRYFSPGCTMNLTIAVQMFIVFLLECLSKIKICLYAFLPDGQDRLFPLSTRQLRLYSCLLETPTPEITRWKWTQKILCVHTTSPSRIRLCFISSYFISAFLFKFPCQDRSGLTLLPWTAIDCIAVQFKECTIANVCLWSEQFTEKLFLVFQLTLEPHSFTQVAVQFRPSSIGQGNRISKMTFSCPQVYTNTHAGTGVSLFLSDLSWCSFIYHNITVNHPNGIN